MEISDDLKAEFRRVGQNIASSIGQMLRQEYRQEDGRWYLYSLGKRQDALSDEEVQWHMDRNHAPFVMGGVTSEDPRWWDEPDGAR